MKHLKTTPGRALRRVPVSVKSVWDGLEWLFRDPDGRGAAFHL
jgi:hypothetical protein